MFNTQKKKLYYHFKIRNNKTSLSAVFHLSDCLIEWNLWRDTGSVLWSFKWQRVRQKAGTKEKKRRKSCQKKIFFYNVISCFKKCIQQTSVLWKLPKIAKKIHVVATTKKYAGKRSSNKYIKRCSGVDMTFPFDVTTKISFSFCWCCKICWLLRWQFVACGQFRRQKGKSCIHEENARLSPGWVVVDLRKKEGSINSHEKGDD